MTDNIETVIPATPNTWVHYVDDDGEACCDLVVAWLISVNDSGYADPVAITPWGIVNTDILDVTVGKPETSPA